MLVKRILSAIAWLPHVTAVSCALVFAFLFWPAKPSWPEWKPLERMPSRFVEARPATLAWKQPVLPAQYAQATCGACHQNDLTQTPQLNHGRQLLVRLNCIGCHRLQGIDRPAMLGPDLTRIGEKVSREWIYKWLKDPKTVTDADGNVVVNGVAMEPLMPKFRLSGVELRALSAYLSTQRRRTARADTRVSLARPASKAEAEEVEAGQTRFNQMFCVTCHALAVNRGGETKLIGGDIGPELTKVGSKANATWLRDWLRNPEGYLQHTRMPQFVWSDRDLHEVVEFLSTRLTDPDLLKDVPQLGPPTSVETDLGKRLFVDKGCAECHVIENVNPRKNFGPDLSALGMAGGPFFVEVSSAKERGARLHFVSDDVSRLEVGVSQIPRSMIAYVQTKITDPTFSGSQANMPKFSLSRSDLDDLTTALLSMSGPQAVSKMQRSVVVERSHSDYAPSGKAGELYRRFKCVQCHTFRGNGGTLAPDLSYEGSRSHRDWLVEFLQNPQTLRPTLTVRMPNFNMSAQDAMTLADYLSSELRVPGEERSLIRNEELTPQRAEDGKKLFEERYACQSCHTIGSSGGYVGPSLNNAGNWLTTNWMEAWLSNPQALVPGTIEPRHAFSGEERKQLAAYLMTLKQAPAANEQSDVKGGGK